MSNDALLMILLVAAWENMDVATVDVGGAYLHAVMDDYTLLKLKRVSVDIVGKVNSAYEKFICLENGKRVLYLRLL